MSFLHQCHLTKTFRPPRTDQVRLGVLSQTKLITGEELYDTAYALGLTSYTREELNSASWRSQPTVTTVGIVGNGRIA